MKRFSQGFGALFAITWLKGDIGGLLATKVPLTGLTETFTGFSGLIGVFEEILSKYLFVSD